MGEVKQHQPPMTIDEQIENLKNIGLIVEDEEYAKRILNDISYFRLIKAYSLNLKTNEGRYRENITFKSLFAHKDEIEKNMEMELEWKELPERKASRILIEKTVDLDDRATWPEQFDYIMDTCIKMKRAFKRYL